MIEKGSVGDAFDDLIAAYEQLGDEFEDKEDVAWLCDTVVSDLENLRDDLTDGIFEPAAPGDPTVVEKPTGATKQDAIRAQIGVSLAAQATEMIHGDSVVAMHDSGDLIIAVDKGDLRDYIDDRDGDGYDNPRFGPPR